LRISFFRKIFRHRISVEQKLPKDEKEKWQIILSLFFHQFYFNLLLTNIYFFPTASFTSDSISTFTN
jgi:hypothetical protein